jgi:predicted transcriptional regulator
LARETKSTIKVENEESFIKISKTLMKTKELGKNGELDVYHVAIIKSLANNFEGVAYTGVTHMMKFIRMSTEQSTTKTRTRESLLRLQEMGHIEIYEDLTMKSKLKELKPANLYFIKPTNKDEEFGFAKVFYKDIQKIVAMKSVYKPKIFATYLNVIGNVFYDSSGSNKNVPISYTKIDTMVKNTKINRKSIVDYLKALYDEEILYFIHFHINNTTTKNYSTRWIHREHTAQWAIPLAEYQYSTDKSKFKGAGIGVSEE